MTPSKRFCAIALTVLASLALAACGDSSDAASSSGGSSGASSSGGSSSGGSSSGGSSGGTSSSGGSSSGASSGGSSGASSGGTSSSGGSSGGSSSGGSSSGGSSGGSSSGGSSGGTSSGGSSSGSGGGVLPFFKESRGTPGHNGNELWLAPIDDPTHPTMLVDGLADGDLHRDTRGGDSQLVTTYDRDTSSGAVSNRKPAKLVYLNGGKLFAVDLGSGQSRTPVQVSSLGGLKAICEQFTDGTLANTWLRVSTSDGGSGDACNYGDDDAETHLVKLDTPSSQPGIKLEHSAGSPHTQQIRSGLIGKDGSFAGFIVTQADSSSTFAGKLCVYDATFGNPQCPVSVHSFSTTMSNTNLRVTPAFAPGQGTVVYLTLTDAGFATHLYRFATDSGVAEATAVTGALSLSSLLADADALYYVSGSGTGTAGETVYTLKHSDGSAAAPVALYLGQGHITMLGASDSRLILTEQDASTPGAPRHLETISKTIPSTNATVLDTVQPDPLGTPSKTAALYSRSLVVAGDRLFFNHTVLTNALSPTGGSIDYNAIQVKADSSDKSTLSGSAWVGSVGNSSTPGHLVLATLVDGGKQLDLFSYRSSDGSQVGKLGTLTEAPTPANNWFAFEAQNYLYATRDLRQSFLGHTGNAFLFAYESLAASKAQADADLYFADVTRAGSLSFTASGEMGSNQPIE